jgi:hypothetical protein
LDDPSVSVRTFVGAYVDSIEFLRVLLVLAREPDREWSDVEVAAVVKLPVDVARTQLDLTCSRGLAIRIDVAPPAFRYHPRTDEFRQMVGELIDLDDHRPVTLIRLIYSRVPSSAQAFADAFRLRKDPP